MDESEKFKCDLCEKSFIEYHHLKTHRLLHDKAYKCEFCCKDFYNFRTLQFHRCNNVLIKCNICGAVFTQTSSLKRHQRVLHSVLI